MAISIIDVKSVTGVSIDRKDGDSTMFAVSFTPDFLFSGEGSFTGGFFVSFTPPSGVTTAPEIVSVEFVENRAGYSIDVTNLELNAEYKMTVSAEKKEKAASGPLKTVTLITHEYESPHCIFRNGRLSIKWNKILSMKGELNLCGDVNAAISLPHSARGHVLDFPTEVYDGASFTAKVAPTLLESGNATRGFFSTPMNVLLSVPEFTGAELSNGILTVACDSAKFTGQYTICLCLLRQGEIPGASNIIAPIAGHETRYDVSNKGCLADYTAHLFLKSKAVSDDLPQFVNHHIQNSNTFTLSDSRIWRSGYYFNAEMNVLQYAETAAMLSDEEIIYTLPPYVNFATDKSVKSIKVDGMTLEISGQNLLLTIEKDEPLTAEKFRQFLAQLFDVALVKNIAPENYYALRSFISRVATYSAEDANYVMHGIGAIKMPNATDDITAYTYEDILPGMVFRVRVSGFRRQTAPEVLPLQGYYQDSQADYFVTLNESKGRLEFDTNLSLLVDSWPDNNTELTTSFQETYGGALDFSLNTLQKPYARLVNSGGVFRSNSTDDSLGAATGMSVFFSDSMKSLDEITDLRNHNGTNLAFRGRAALTVCITVFFENNPFIVPAGTTLAAFVSRFGIQDLNTATLKRRNHAGKLVDVFAELSKLATLPLANGDVLASVL